MSEQLHTKNENEVTDWIVYGGVKYPKYLITEASLSDKLQKYESILAEIRTELAKGTPGGDAGDAHGQYHNEVAWYREQDLEMRSKLASRIGGNLQYATIINDYEEVRQLLESMGMSPETSITLSSKATIQYGESQNDTGVFLIVSPLDNNPKIGWLSTETPLAKAIQGKTVGQSASYKIESEFMKVKILQVE